MKRALITGSEGFTGRYLARELASHGWEVWGAGLDRLPADPCYRQLNLNNAEDCLRVVAEIKPEAIVHLAAIAFVDHGAEAIYQVNLLGTRNLLAAIAAAPKKPDCVLLASSANVYGNQTAGALNEDTPANPANDYAVSKLAMEYLARLWMPELPIVITRPFNYTGVGQAENFLIPKIVSHFQRQAEFIELGNVEISRDFSDVRSIAAAYRRLLEVAPTGEIVNLCSGISTSLGRILELATTISGHQLEVRASSPGLVRSNEVTTLCGDPSKLKRLIGDWDTPPIGETLRWMLESSPS